jgi:hypothetical protein
MEFTPEVIYKLDIHEIIVFSTNLEGKHCRGIAKYCFQKFGAVYGQAIGLQGQCYAFATRTIDKKLPLSHIKTQVETFIEFAKENIDLKFYVTKIGSDEFEIGDIAEIFMDYEYPDNVIFPKEFYDWTKM